MAKFFLSIAFLLATIISFAQADVDSLKNLLAKQADETAKMHIKLELGDAYSNVSADSALFWYSQVFPKELDDENAFSEWLSNAQQSSVYYLSVALARAGQIKLNSEKAGEGLSWLEKAFYLADSIKQPELAVHCSDIIAVYYAQTDRPELAIEQFNRSLVIYKTISDAQGIAYCLGNLAVINAGVGNLAESAKQFEELILFKRQNGISSGLIDDYINVATLYYKLDDHRKSEENWLKAYSLAKQFGQKGYIEDVLLGLGELYINLDQTKTALQYYKDLYAHLSDEQQTGNAMLIAANNIAAILYEQGKFNEALPYWEKTYNLAMTMENVQAEADALLSLSNIHFQLGNNDKGSAYHQKYMEHSKQFATSEAIAKSYIAMAEVFEGQNELEKALQQYAKAIAIYQTEEDIANEALTNISIAGLFVKQQKYQSALDFYNANLSSENDLPLAVVATSYQGKAEVLRLQLQYLNALQLYDKALQFWASIENFKQAIVCLNSMGTLFETTGNLPESVRRYEQALSIAVKTENDDAIAAISNNLGVVYRKLGDYPKALDAYEKALKVYLETNNSREASYCYNNIGIVYENQGDYTNASIYYEKSLSIKQDYGDKQGLATSYMNMGNVYKFSDNPKKAEDYYNQALTISTEISDRQGQALSYGNLAALKIEGKSFHEAINLSLKSLAIAREIDLKSAVKEAYRQLAWAYTLTLEPDSAEKAYLQVLEMNYSDIFSNFSILSESEKELFFRTVAEDFDRFTSFSLQRVKSNPEVSQAVYNNLLRNKGLLLKSSTAMRTAIFTSNNEQLIASYEQWIALKQEIASLLTQPINERSESINDLLEKANSLERELVRSSSAFSDFEKSTSYTWESVRDYLKDNEAAIEFTHFKQSTDSVFYCALIVRPGYASPLMVPLFEEQKLAKIIGSFGGNNLSYINSVYGVNNELNDALYKLIWKPIEEHLQSAEEVFISPSGILHKVSFAALSPSVNRYLMDDFSVRMVSTTANVISQKPFAYNSSMSVSLFGGITYGSLGNPNQTWKFLKGTEAEVEKIASILMPSMPNIKVYTDSLGTEQAFKQAATESPIVHIATHGFFFPNPEEVKQVLDAATEYGEVDFRGGSPTFGMDNFVNNLNPLMRSGLVFANVNDYWSGYSEVITDDGVLTALEVINIDLRNNQLVVMSACETGLGDIAGSEGVYGLQRAFKMAGSSYLIMSLWQVPDSETAEFMEYFYTELTRNKSLNEAFSSAQRAMRQKYDPYYWAAFVLVE